MHRNNSTVMNARDAQLELEEAQAGVGEQISRLKTAFSGILTPSIAKVLGWVEKLTSGFADVAESWAEAADEFRNPLPTESVEDARAQLEAWNDELVRLKTELAGVSEATDADTFWRLSYQVDDLTGKISRGTEQLADMEAAEASAAETANATADAVDKMTISANGFSVELANSNLTMEEATERLQTYTDAATNMFSRINTESELSYQQMLDNLRHNIDATNNFADNMASIAGELPAEIAEMFYAGGPEVYAGIVATLAAANEGGEKGLAEMRAMWQEGGEAAKDAFLQSVGAVDVTENPGTKMAEAMDSDVSAEQAGQDLVDRTVSAISARVVDGGTFYSSGRRAVDRFIEGLKSKSWDAYNAGMSIANSARNGMNTGGGGTGGHSSAGGLDYVPYDGYPAVLHRGESVLTKAEAEDWRRGTPNAAGITIVQNIQSVPQTPVELAAATAAYFETARWAM